MSIQAMVYAMEQRVVSEPTARHVLLCLANYANKDGTAAFASASTLAQDTGLSLRTVRYRLRDLLNMGLLWYGNQKLAEVYIGRGDKRPIVYDMALADDQVRPPIQRALPVDNSPHGVHHLHPVEPHGVQLTTERGAPPAPNPSLTRIHKNPLPPEGGAGASPSNPPNPKIQRTGNSIAGTGQPVNPGDSAFEAFWQAYPRKVDKLMARRVWRTLQPDAKLQAAILAAVRLWSGHEAWQRHNGQFIPKASSWLRRERWADMPTAAQPPVPTPTWQPPAYTAAPVPQAARELLARLKRGQGTTPTQERGQSTVPTQERSQSVAPPQESAACN